jgi:hypothetical protein
MDEKRAFIILSTKNLLHLEKLFFLHLFFSSPCDVLAEKRKMVKG